jgi:hypothetical protein
LRETARQLGLEAELFDRTVHGGGAA